jgi:hypothetical protein
MSSADEELKEFQIRLSLKGNPPKLKSIQSSKPNHVVTVAPLMTMAELSDVAHELFGVPKNKKYEVDLWSGFPPKKIDVGDAGSLASLVTTNGIQKNDSLTVKIEKITTAKSRKRPLPSGGNDAPEVVKVSSSNPAPVAISRPKRAAAQAASESFKDVIRAQDKIMKKQTKSSASTKKNKSSAPTLTAAQTAARKKAADARAAAANARKLASLAGGRRLNDDAPPLPSPSLSQTQSAAPPGRKPKSENTTRSIFKGLNSEEDISFALISSIDSGSKRNGKVSKVLRGAMRKTVEKSYATSRAVVRNSAITSKKLTFAPCETQSGYTVRYPKGVEGVGFYEDQVHIITPLMLKAIVQAVYDDHDEENTGASSGREMLKPQNMALLSPRVFWSLWYHFREKCSTIEEALNLLLPDLDWAFLHRRSRQLSEKAKDNLRREITDKKETSKEDHEAGIKAIQAVEKAMETMYDENVANVRERAAQAALLRFGNNAERSVDSWTLVTPTEVDEDELRECIAGCDDGLSEEAVAQRIHIFVSKLSINNWRLLANSISTDVHRSLKENGLEITLESIETWIGAAQTRSIEEIMLEILEGDQDLYAILRDELSSGTPKDLGLWAVVPQLVIEEAETELKVAEEDVNKFCERAKQVTANFEWLQLYSTSIM